MSQFASILEMRWSFGDEGQLGLEIVRELPLSHDYIGIINYYNQKLPNIPSVYLLGSFDENCCRFREIIVNYLGAKLRDMSFFLWLE